MIVWKNYQTGINLGGWLSQCPHTILHYDTFISEEDIKKIKTAGYDHVRCPFDYNLIQTKTGEFITDNFKYLDKVIEWCQKNGLNIILDLHKTCGFSFDPGENEGTNFFNDERYISQFLSLWEEVAKRYGYDSEHIAFELLNEVTDPAYMGRWMEIVDRAIDVIRKHTTETKILIGGYWHNSVYAVKDLSMPKDKNIVYNFHCYEPLAFTHQNAPWVPGTEGRFMKYPLTKEEFLEKISDANGAFTHTLEFLDGDNFSSGYFENLFSEAIRVSEERGVILYCGEYGVIDQADKQSKENWYKDITETFKKHSIGNASWTYKKLDFGIFEP